MKKKQDNNKLYIFLAIAIIVIVFIKVKNTPSDPVSMKLQYYDKDGKLISQSPFYGLFAVDGGPVSGTNPILSGAVTAVLTITTTNTGNAPINVEIKDLTFSGVFTGASEKVWGPSSCTYFGSTPSNYLSWTYRYQESGTDWFRCNALSGSDKKWPLSGANLFPFNNFNGFTACCQANGWGNYEYNRGNGCDYKCYKLVTSGGGQMTVPYTLSSSNYLNIQKQGTTTWTSTPIDVSKTQIGTYTISFTVTGTVPDFQTYTKTETYTYTVQKQ